MSDLTPEQRAEALRLAQGWTAKPLPSAKIEPKGIILVARTLKAAEAEVAELRNEIDTVRKACGVHFSDISQMALVFRRAERAEARVKRLEEALRAIQAVAVTSQDHHAEPHRLDWLREIEGRARAALEEGAE